MIIKSIIASLLLPVSLLAQSLDAQLEIGYKSIKVEEIKKHISIFTSDSLEGRETTMPGQKKAAQYISNFFKSLHLQPIGDNGTYLQHFYVDHIRMNPDSKIITRLDQHEHTYKWGTDFIADTFIDTIVSGKVAFVGFSDTILDSAAQANLQGCFVFVFIGKKEQTSDTTKTALLLKMNSNRYNAGAVATMLIPDEEGPVNFSHMSKFINGFGLENGIMRIKNNYPVIHSPSLRFIISPTLADELLKSSGRSLQQLRNDASQNPSFSPVFLDNATVTIESKTLQETKETENVVGLLPGSDTTLQSEVVVFSAHYDHLGKGRDNTIFPGADDNSSGSSAVMELASAFSNNPTRPKRSLMFILLAGEEKGLLGSQYYVTHPLFPLSQTMADINIDMIGRMDPVHEALKDTHYIYIIGSNKISTELDSLLLVSNGETEHMTFDYTYDDKNNTEHLYFRGDHYNFAKNDVPIIFFFTGLHADYHKTTDTIDKILFNRIEKICHVIYDLGWKLGNFDHMLYKNAR